MIAELKDSSDDWDGVEGLRSQLSTVQYFPGTEVLLLQVPKIGDAGTITVTAGINPGEIRRIYIICGLTILMPLMSKVAQTESTRLPFVTLFRSC